LDELVNNQGTADKNVSIECLRLLSCDEWYCGLRCDIV
jgi:hypothetical protein